MKEIGGYIEFERYRRPMLHEDAIALNCGRNCLAYLIRARQISKIVLPYFICDSVAMLCRLYNVGYRYYHINGDFTPEEVKLDKDEWLYIVDYYGQISKNKLERLRDKYIRVIVDYSQAYFEMPVDKVDSLYTCRKFFGVADGAFLYTDSILNCEFERDESYQRMGFLLGRFERTANEFYDEYVANNEAFINEPIKRMSKLTNNLLRGIDYDFVRQRRTENFAYLHAGLSNINELALSIPEGAFMYPLYIKTGKKVRELLRDKKIYIPVLWPDVFKICSKNTLEYDMAENILPLPVDQRYDINDMIYLVGEIKNILG